MIAVYYGKFLAAAAAAELLPLGFLGEALAPLVDATLVKPELAVAGKVGAAYMVVEVLRNLKASVGEEGTTRLYAASKLDMLSLLPAWQFAPPATPPAAS